jgi:RHS repeat-associated protein
MSADRTRRRRHVVVLPLLAATLAFTSTASSRYVALRVASQPVGSLPARFGVDGNGSATWTLDVEVPPGTAGVAPALQITYDSHRSNGYLGMGFALSGISAITRCGANQRVDAFKAGVAFDERDRFCIDGRRLIAVDGKDGADGTVYRTEIETSTVITSHGKCGKGPCSFTGTDKDGSTLSFGGTTGPTGSRVLAQNRQDGAVRTWSIDARTDLNGNRVTVSYVNDVASGEYYPSRIDYTSNDRAGLGPQRSVRFSYAARSDVVRRFLGGSQVRIAHLLTSIATYVAVDGRDQAVLDYRFEYAASDVTRRSRLQRLTLCDAEKTCWPATVFDWYTDSAAFGPARTSLPGPTYVNLDGRQYPFGVLLDLNGDGVADYSKAVQFAAGTRDLAVYLGRPDGSFERAKYALPGPLWRVAGDRVVQTGVLTDVNGDGLVDFSAALRNEDNGTSDFTVWIGGPDGFEREPAYQLPGQLFWQIDGQTLASGVLADLNGDGLPDYSRATLLRATGQKLLEIYKGTGTGFQKTGTSLPGPLFAVDASRSVESGILRDIDGDGLADYSAATVNADSGTEDLRVFRGRSPDFTFEYVYDLPGQMFWVINGTPLSSGALVDVNGDGIPDYSRATRIESTGQELLDVHLGTARGFTAPAFALPGPLYSILANQSFVQGLLTNWNGDGTTRYSRATRWADGRQDLALHVGDGDAFRPMGKSLPRAVFRVTPAGTYADAEYQDVNGDGVTDYVDAVCTLLGDGSFVNCDLGVRLAEGPFSDLLRTATNGFGGRIVVDYGPLQGGLYRQTGAPAYPIRNAAAAMVVVAGYATEDGRGARYRYAYAYSGARVDALGYGWLGFETVAMTDLAGGRASRVAYEQAFPFTGVVKESQALDGQGTLLARSVYEYEDNAPPPLRQKGVHQPLRTSETFTQYADGAPSYSLRQLSTYDAHGNATVESDLADTSTGDDDVFTCTRYLNDPGRGRYGYPVEVKTTRTLAACRAFLDASDPSAKGWVADTDLLWTKFGHDASMNVVSVAHYDDSNGAFLTEGYTFDAVGNVLTATNPSGDTTTFTYDDTYRTFRSAITSPPLDRDGAAYRLKTATTQEPAFGVLVSTTDPSGNVTTQAIDGFGRPVEVRGPDGAGRSTLLVTTTWRSEGGAHYLESRQRPAWSDDDPAGWYWDRDYHDGLDRTYRTERSGLRTGQPATIASDVTFDPQGRVRSTTAPYYAGDAAPATTIEYDVYNRPTLSTDPAGVKHRIDYAEGGRKITRTAAFDTPEAQTEISYLTGRGFLRERVAPNGSRTLYTRDPLGRITSATSAPEPRTTTLAYDSVGRPRRLENATVGVSTWTYDVTGTLTRTSDGAGNTTEYTRYDAMGRLRARTMTSLGTTSTTAYDYDNPAVANGLGNLTGVTTTQSPVGTFSYTYGYTAYGQASAGTMTIAGERYVYGSSYDPLGRLSGAVYPSGDQLAQTYLTATDLGTVSLAESGSAAPRTYATYGDYTALGQPRLTRYDRAGIEQTSTYFPIGPAFAQLHTVKAVAGGKTLYSRAYSWNRLNAVTALSDALEPAASETYGYDGQPPNAHMGFLTEARGPYGAQSYAYDALGNVVSKNGVTMTYATGTDRLTATSDGEQLAYFPNGALRSRTDGTGSWTYAYDGGGLLVRVDRATPGGTQSGYAAYDASGRRVFDQRVGEAARTYRVTEHFEVVDLGNGAFQHTLYVPGTVTPVASVTRAGRGNVPGAATERALAALHGGSSRPALAAWHSVRAMAYEHGGALAGAGVLALLALFSLPLLVRGGRPQRRSGPRPAWVAPLVALCVLLQGGPAHSDLVPGPNGPGVPAPGVVFFLVNALESTVLATDANGAVTARVAYLPDGAVDQPHSAGVDDFRPKFVGREWDPTTALYQMGARYYSPAVGRFISPDPLAQFASPYVYAGNNPVSAIDPDGEFAFVIAIIIGAVVGAYFGGALVNHDLNPMHWNWRSGKTYAGLFGGALIGAVGAAAGAAAIQGGVAIGASGGLAAEAAGVAVGIGGQVLVGAGENAAFTALGGGSAKEVLQAAGEGAVWGAAFAVAGEAIGGLAAQFARRSGPLATGAESGAAANALRREAGAAEDALADACSASFVAGTPVLGADGVARPVEDVRVGDRLAARDVPADRERASAVVRLVRRRTDALVTLTFAGGNSVTTTPEHPFRAYQRGFVPARDLGPGERLSGRDGRPVEIASARSYRAPEPVTVYNFEVEGAHTYRVGVDGALVHNPKKVGVCRASFSNGVVTEEWNLSELERRFPQKAEYQAILRDIRAKARNANKFIKSGRVTAYTRVAKPVRTASREWVAHAWVKKFGPTSNPPTSVRAALKLLRKHFGNQDVDEYLTRIQGGLTIREGAAENQGPLNSFVNQTSGAAMGALSRRGKAERIFVIQVLLSKNF